MKLLKKLVLPAVVATAVALPMPADAGTITFIHAPTGTTYSLFVQENCISDCEVNLTIDFSDPSVFDGKFLDAVQFKIDGSTPTSADLDATNAGDPGDWDVTFANLNANQCGGGSTTSVCTEFSLTSLGYGPLALNGGGADGMLFFNFLVNWDDPLVLGDNLIRGNIRAAYNNPDGSNFSIFSPGGTNFGGDNGGGGGGVVVAEPASLLLFGMAAFGGAYRMRRRQTA